MDITNVMLHHQMDTAIPDLELDVDARNTEMLNTLSPYVENLDILENLILSGSMHAEFEVIKNFQGDMFVLDNIAILVEEFRKAREISRSRASSVVTDSHDDLRHAISNMAQAATLDVSRNDIPDLARVKKTIRDMGDVAEGCLLPFMRFRAALARISHSGSDNYAEAKNTSFGETLQYLDSLTPHRRMHDLGIPLAVSQARNVGQHNSYAVLGDVVTLKYGKNLKHSFSLRIDQLEIIAFRISVLFVIYKTASTLFTLDYLEDYQGKLKYNPQIAEYTHLSILAQDLILHSLLIEKFIIEGDFIKMKLKYVGDEALKEVEVLKLIQGSIRRYFANYVSRDFEVKVRCGLKKYKFAFRVISSTAYRLLP